MTMQQIWNNVNFRQSTVCVFREVYKGTNAVAV